MFLFSFPYDFPAFSEPPVVTRTSEVSFLPLQTDAGITERPCDTGLSAGTLTSVWCAVHIGGCQGISCMTA